MGHMDKLLRVLLVVVVALVLVFSAFAGGFVFARQSNPLRQLAAPSAAKADVGDQVDEVLGILDDQALTPPKETSATAGAIQGVLDSTGDKWAMYFDARHYKYFNEQNSGQFGGIGVTIGEKNGTAYVVTVMPDTPAAKAGMKPNDVFVEVAGVKQDKWSSDEIVKRVRGDVGTRVKLVVRRGTDLKSFSLTRAMIEVPNVQSSMLPGGVGYIRMFSFNQRSETDLRKAIDSLEQKGAKGFVVDVRDNPGGLLDQAVRTSSLFIQSGVIVRIDERDKPEQVQRATGHVATGAPVVLLVNGNSASAAEILAGALQDHARAELVGTKTFGKGSVQTIEELGDGSAIKFTIAHYLTPKKRVIDGKGVTPDYVVQTKTDQEYDPESQKDVSKDAQLTKAIEVLRKQL